MLGGIAMLLVPVQLSTRLRSRAPLAHRLIGRVSLTSIAGAAVAGAVLARFSLAGVVGLLGFGSLAVAWFVSAANAYRSIRNGRVGQHRRWAVRTFALTYAAVTLRLWLGVLVTAQIAIGGASSRVAFDHAYHVVPFLAWVPNLLVAEWIIGRTGRRRRPAIR